jgi:hypothetical protein
MSDSINVHVINLATYEQPKIIETSRNEWVEYGKRNDYYEWLIERTRKSPTNNTIINNMVKLIYGKGIDCTDASRKPNEYAQMISLFPKRVLRNVITDLKSLGDAYFQVIYNKQHTKVLSVEHIATNLIRPSKCNDEGDIESYWFSNDWSDIRKFEPTEIPAFGTSNKEIELLRIIPYSLGMKYFSAPDWAGCIPYTVLEEEISEYLINEAQNHFSGTKVVNFMNGVPDEEKQKVIAKKVTDKLTGSTGQKVIISFAENIEMKTTVDDIPLNDAPQHYEYLSNECRDKILAGHTVVSPMLVGISKESQGFSNNADEIEVASKYFYNTAVNYFQELIIDAMDSILAFNNVSLDLFFRPVGLLDVKTRELAKSEPLVEMKDHSFIDKFGEVEDLERWVLIDSRNVDYDSEEDLDLQVQEWSKKKQEKKTLLSKIIKLVSTGSARPNANSEQDAEVEDFNFKVRYKYVGNNTPDRDFCKAMMRADKIYRKEDIIAMGSQSVNAGFGEFGADQYSIWLYKGGARCNHKWERRTYVSLGSGIDVNNPNATTVSTAKAREFGYRVNNEKEVSMKPNDMPLKGFSPNNKNLPSDV